MNICCLIHIQQQSNLISESSIDSEVEAVGYNFTVCCDVPSDNTCTGRQLLSQLAIDCNAQGMSVRQRTSHHVGLGKNRLAKQLKMKQNILIKTF